LIAIHCSQALAALCRNYIDPGGLLLTGDEVRAMQVPMLAVAGELDVYRRYLERMQGVAPDFSLIVLEGQGHGGPAFFDALARDAVRFFQRIGKQGENT
jgi:glyoxylase-like metal-dependent hydrolase (beta-lactamase superfamily II)